MYSIDNLFKMQKRIHTKVIFRLTFLRANAPSANKKEKYFKIGKAGSSAFISKKVLKLFFGKPF